MASAGEQNKLVGQVRKYYDRLIAAAVLLGLLVSLSYLAVRINAIKEEQEQFDADIGGFRPRYEKAAPVEEAAFEAIKGAIVRPVQFLDPQGTNTPMFVPETRVACVYCWRPVPFAATNCPLCKASQPSSDGTDVASDRDADGMWDSWERDNGLDPNDPGDASRDPDGDKYTNLEEFQASPRTGPNDPASFPPPEKDLVLKTLSEKPFQLRFMSKAKLPDRWTLGINTRRGRTHFVKVGDEVEGFRVTGFEEKEEIEQTGGMKVRRDVSVLTLQRGDQVFALVLRAPERSYTEYGIVLEYPRDGLLFNVKPKDEFNLRGRQYRVLEVDSAAQTVLIEVSQGGGKTAVAKRAESKP
jgi:hypothetical protein